MLERLFPERRLFLKSETDTRFIRLKPGTQAIAYLGATAVLSWTIVATAILLMDSIGASNFRDQAKRDLQIYQERLNAISLERDNRAAEALAAQERFNAALAQVSDIQSELLTTEIRRNELATAIDVIQTTLRDTMQEREAARTELAELKEETAQNAPALAAASPAPLELMSEVLAETAEERDQVVAEAAYALELQEAAEYALQLMQEKNDYIFRQLEEAMLVSVEPLDEMFSKAGLSSDRLIDEVRRGYSGQGGPMTPLTFSTRGEEPSPEEIRANRLLTQMDLLNLYRIAAEKAPFASPIRDAVRYTSGFGYRRDPKTGGRRMHKGADFAGPVGTDIHATADGVVVQAGWQSGFGKTVRIRHEFGIETLYAHNSRLHVTVGQKVSRGDHIADMGNTGRSTGTHLHYEVHVNGTPVNPMIYIKAARDVFKEQDKRAELKER